MIAHEHKHEYYECYSGKLKKFLLNEMKIDYICRGRNYYNPSLIFWVFIKDERFEDALKEWKRRSVLIKLGFSKYKI